MQNTIKIPTILWLLAAFAFSPLSPIPSYNPLETAVRFIGAALFAYFAYLAYRKGLTPAEHLKPASVHTLLRGKEREVFIVSGAVVGFAVGLFTRPEISSGVKMPLSLLFGPSGSQAQYALSVHLLVAVVIGAVLAFFLSRRQGFIANTRAWLMASGAASVVALAYIGLSLVTGGASANLIAGRYQDETGSTIEFMVDGTAILSVKGERQLWKWSDIDGKRLKIEVNTPVLGVVSDICDYGVSTVRMQLMGCKFAAKLTRI